MDRLDRGTSYILPLGLIIRLALAPLTVQSYDFVRLYYSAFNIIKGTNPYSVYEFPYPPVPLYLLSLIATVYFGAGLYQENLAWPSGLDVPPSLLKAEFISVTLMSFHVPPPIFNLLFKIPMILSDTAIAVLLYKLCLLKTGKIGISKNAMGLWYLNPIVIWMSSIHGAFDCLGVLLAVLGLYYLVRSNYATSGFFLATGIVTKLFPAFLIPISLTASVKAKRVSHFVAGVLLSFLVCLTPILFFDFGSLLYSLVANRPSALFVGGLNPFAVKYAFRSVETFVFENSTALFLILIFALGLSSLLLCFYWWGQSSDSSLSTMNRMMLASVILAYFFVPLAVQPQYSLWALPFMIMDIASVSRTGHILHSIRVRLKVQSRTLLAKSHILSYPVFFHVFWVSALLFEVSLQGPSVFLPIAMRSEGLMNLLANATIWWVKDQAVLRTLIFFASGMACTFAYTMFLLKSVVTKRAKMKPKVEGSHGDTCLR